MEYDLASKKLESSVGYVRHRSVYGDMHATRDVLMNAEHVTLLQKHGIIEVNIAMELLKPFHRDRIYTEAYLRTHPEYTGIRPEMTAFSTADRHQKKRDKDMEKFVEDYEAGRIDEDGNPIGHDGNDIAHGTVIDAPSRFHDHSEYQTYSPSLASPMPLRKVLPKFTPATPGSAQASSSPPLIVTSKTLSPSPEASSKSSKSTSQSIKRNPRVHSLRTLSGGEDYSLYE